MLSRFPKSDPIWNISNPNTVQRRTKEIYGKDMILYRSNAKNKKYYIITPEGHKVNFGSNMEDFTKHKDEQRRENYLKRSGGIRGNWKENKYSANMLSRSLLWNG